MFRCSAGAIVPAPVTKTPHDALFKSVFQHPENALAERQHVLSAEHVSGDRLVHVRALKPGSFAQGLAGRLNSKLKNPDAVLGAWGLRLLVYWSR